MDKSQKSPSGLEYTNRLNEVLDFDIGHVTNQEGVQHFTDKVISLVDFIEGDRTYKNLVGQLSNYHRIKEAENKLLGKGNEILKELTELLEIAENAVTENKMTLPTQSEVFAQHINQGAYSPTVSESLGQDIDTLRQKLTNDAPVAVSEIDGLIADAFHTNWDFKTLGIEEVYPTDLIERLEQSRPEYRKLKEEWERLRRQYGPTDYDVLKGLWVWQQGEMASEGYFRFMLSPAGAMLSGTSIRHFNYDEVRNDLRRTQACARSLAMRFDEELTRKSHAWYKRTGRWFGKAILWVGSAVIKIVTFFYKPS